MRKFVLNTLLFFCLSLTLFFGFHLLLMNTRNKLLKFPEEIRTVYLGNSTVECAVNDNFCNNSVNFARRTEPINFLYAKVKLLKEINPQIDTIVIGLDDIILFNNNLAYINGSSLYFLDKFDKNDWSNNLLNSSFGKYSMVFSHLYDLEKIEPMIQSFFYDNNDSGNLNIGGHLQLHRNKLQKDIDERRKKSGYHHNVNNFPLFNKYYLDRIVKYCEQNHIKLIFLSTPKHKETWKEKAYISIHDKYYPNIELMDFMKYPLEEKYFSDCIHLNYEGAILFSKILNRSMNSNDKNEWKD